jgi:hypothetical protein
MGFSYSAYGLCCDFCGADHTTRKYVKKIDCPYGFCQAWATCDQCRAAKKHMASSCTNEDKTHKELCKVRMIEYEIEKLNKKGIKCCKSGLLCSNCKANVIRIENGSKFSNACIYEKCKYSRNFEELQKLQAKVMEVTA